MANGQDWKRGADGNYVRLTFAPENVRTTEIVRYGNVTGYGPKQPTFYLVRPDGSKRWHRVYCAIYGNIGSAYIIRNGEHILVDLD